MNDDEILEYLVNNINRLMDVLARSEIEQKPIAIV